MADYYTNWYYCTAMYVQYPIRSANHMHYNVSQYIQYTLNFRTQTKSNHKPTVIMVLYNNH